MIPAIIAHVVITIFFIYRFALAFSEKKKHSEQFQKSQLGVEIFASFIMICCFLLNETFDLRMKYEEGYYAFTALSIISLTGFWVYRSINDKYLIVKKISTIFIGLLFWLALIVGIKLAPLYIFFLFPLYGFL
jgi:hypothetical protein